MSSPVVTHVVKCMGQENVLECTRTTKTACCSPKGLRDCLTVQSSSDEKAGAQRGRAACLGSHSMFVAELLGSTNLLLLLVHVCVSAWSKCVCCFIQKLGLQNK